MKLIFLLIFFFSSSAVMAQWCDYSINIDGYFPVTIQTSEQTLPYALQLTREQNSSTPNCQNYRLYFAKGNANSYQRKAYSGSNSIPYNLYSDINRGTILKDFADAGNGEFIPGHAPNQFTPYTSTWYVGVPNIYENFVAARAGVYTDVLPINIYQIKNNGSVEFQLARWINLSFTVPRYVEMSIVPENQPHDKNSTIYIMNFGNMTSNQELRADMRIVGNVGYGVTLSSQNGGKMNKTGGGTQIPYSIKVGSGSFFSPTNAGSPYYLFGTNDPTSLAGQRYPITVKLGNVPANPDDGEYEEVITLTVQVY